jgi:hypothetical protein
VLLFRLLGKLSNLPAGSRCQGYQDGLPRRVADSDTRCFSGSGKREILRPSSLRRAHRLACVIADGTSRQRAEIAVRLGLGAMPTDVLVAALLFPGPAPGIGEACAFPPQWLADGAPAIVNGKHSAKSGRNSGDRRLQNSIADDWFPGRASGAVGGESHRVGFESRSLSVPRPR